MTSSAIAAAIEKARADERAAIVAWLRDKSQDGDEQIYSIFGYSADEIERGDHLK